MKVITENCKYLKGLLECLLYCAQQGIRIRGHCENMDDMSINVGNFPSLVMLMSRHDVFKQKLNTRPRNASWLGHDIQNELLSMMAQFLSAKITAEVKEAQYYTLIVDETKDARKYEEMSFVLRYVHNCIVHECFLSYTYSEKLDASVITGYILLVLTYLQLDITECVSECYDGHLLRAVVVMV